MSTTISIAAAHTKFFHKILLNSFALVFLPLFNVGMWSKSQLQILYKEALPLVLLMVDGRFGRTNNTFTTAQFSELQNTFLHPFALVILPNYYCYTSFFIVHRYNNTEIQCL